MTARKHAELIKQWADDNSIVIEWLKDDGDGKGEWTECVSPTWQDVLEYRIKPTKPSIDWSHVHPDYKWMAKDEDGEMWLYEVEPSLAVSGWVAGYLGGMQAMCFASAKPGSCHWRDSLVQRPGEE